MGYRNDLEAATEKAEALARENERLRQETERVKRELAEAQAEASQEKQADTALASLAAEGERRRAAQARAEAATLEQHRREEAASQERWFGRLCSPLSLNFMGNLLMSVVPPLIGIAAVIASLSLLHKGRGGLAALVAVTTIGPAAGLWLGRRPLERRAARRERAWLGQLPFAVNGYEKAVADNGLRPTGLVVKIRFSAGAPDQAFFASLVAGVYEKSPARFEENQGYFELPPYRNPCRSFHRAVDRMLLPLHQKHPIAALTVELHPGFDYP